MNTKAQTTRSADLYARAVKVLPGGVSRNTVLRDPYPVYADHGTGCRVTDIEGVTRLDFSNNMASLIHGHACQRSSRRFHNNSREGLRSRWRPRWKCGTPSTCAVGIHVLKN